MKLLRVVENCLVYYVIRVYMRVYLCEGLLVRKEEEDVIFNDSCFYLFLFL